MKHSLTTVSCLLLAFSGLCRGAGNPSLTTNQPGQTVSNSVPSLELRPSFKILKPGNEEFSLAEVRHDRVVARIWVASLVAVAASTSMDAATSWGKQEGNGFLASSNGTFGARGVSIKAGMLAAVVVPQLIFRNHKQLRTKFAIGNFIEAGIFTGVSVHNLGVAART